jgi:tetratricopeptide (TPR) repeat protein
VTIFVLDDERDVQRLHGGRSRYVQGFYVPNAGGSVAVVSRLSAKTDTREISPETVLLHEYSHHFMSYLTSLRYPRWYVEGFAEFYSGVQFKDDGGVVLGMPPLHRRLELFGGREVPIRKFLEFDGGASEGLSRYNSFYGQSWVLFHYLQFDPARKGQLVTYETLLSKGVGALDAAVQAFGDLDQLQEDMEDYVRRYRLTVASIGPEALKLSPTTVRKLRPGEAAMMPVVIQSRVGVTPEQAKALVPKARAVAERFPDDPVVLAALAEAEYDADNNDAAIAAADRALSLDANNVRAHIQKGYALFEKAADAESKPEAWKEVRGQFLKANAVENDNPVPLLYFYYAYQQQGVEPTSNAVEGLEWAMQLAPFDPSLRWLVARQMINDERWADAAKTLVPLAYSPHPGQHTDRALALLKEVEARIGAPTAASAETVAND